MSALAGEYHKPAEVLFRPPIAVPFQLHDIARFYLEGRGMATWDTGVGKTALASGVGCVALEQGAADYLVIFCEMNKMADWKRELAKFTSIPDGQVAIYYGPKRKKLLADLPRVLITSYETGRQDAAVFETPRKLHDGPLTGALAGRRAVVIYDESSKLGNRSSKLYKAHKRLLDALRKGYPATRVYGLTGTPMEGGSYIQFFNQLRLIAPDAMPIVTEWERRCIKYWKEVGAGGRVPVYDSAGIAWFRQQATPLLSRRRKSDPEVREHFPPFTEKFERIAMRGDQRGIYERLEDLAWDEDGEFQQVPGLSQLLYQLAGDPMAVQYAAERGSSKLAKMAWRVLGGDLLGCSSAKADYLYEWYVNPIAQAGNKLLVFTFFGQTVLPALRDRLERKSGGQLALFTYHGGMSQAARDVCLDNFKAHPGGAVLLASDAASKGLNIPEASYTIEYEVARTSATRTQRAGRGHRFGGQDPVTFVTFTLDGTIEARSAVPKMLTRNQEQDYMLGDEEVEGYTTADDRRELFASARKRKGISA